MDRSENYLFSRQIMNLGVINIYILKVKILNFNNITGCNLLFPFTISLFAVLPYRILLPQTVCYDWLFLFFIVTNILRSSLTLLNTSIFRTFSSHVVLSISTFLFFHLFFVISLLHIMPHFSCNILPISGYHMPERSV